MDLRPLVRRVLGLSTVAAARAVGSPRQVTLALACALAAAAILLQFRSRSVPIVDLQLPGTVVVAVMVLLFFLTEHLLLNVEFRREALSLTMAGIPVALAVVLAPVHTAILARVVGAVIALLLQRISWDKVVYNVAAYAFEIGASTALARLALGAQHHLDAGSFAVVLVVVVVVDQAMNVLVLSVIALHGGRFGRADIISVLVTALSLSVVTCAFATAVIVLVDLTGTLGAVLIAIVTVVAFGAYRGYVSTRLRHQSLELMHSFVADGVGAESMTALAEQLLGRIRGLMNAGTAELRLFDRTPAARHNAVYDRIDEAADAAVRMIVSDDGFRTTHDHMDPTDWLAIRVRTENEPALLKRNTKDGAVRSWLSTRGLRDAVMVPLPSSPDTSGLVIVSDRLGETATFTADDLSLLQTLTGHLAVALRSTRLVETLSFEASHDSLTGLHNRAHLTACIHAALDELPRRPDVAVLLLDLDGFKEVNDTLGHDAGDRLLRVVAQRLLSHTPAGTTVARLGGDEFAVLLPGLRRGEVQALEIAREVADALSQPVHLDEARLDTQASIGVAVTGSGDSTGGDMLRQADTAMYAAKATRSRISVYSAEMDRIRTERMELLADLRSALRTQPEQFVVYYQPKVDLHSGATVGAEALVRWQHPRLGFIEPDLFIPLAEATGLIEYLTPLVLNSSLTECATWTAQGHDVSVAVNISARNIENPDLPAMVAKVLGAHRVRPGQLILEITESSVMGEPEDTIPVLRQLNDLGLGLSLDDFGTGYSSLAYLQQLPVGEVKIDRSFVHGLRSPDPSNSRALISSIAGLSRSLGLRVVAEGIEDEESLCELRELGCDIAQGYYIGRPMPADRIHAWLDHHKATQRIPPLRLVATGLG